MSIYGDLVDGLRAVLESGITGLKATAYPAQSMSHFPCAVIIPEPLDPQVAFKGNTFTGRLRVVFLVSAAENAEGFARLYDHIDPIESGKSVIAAVRADRTLNAKADDADVVAIEHIGQRDLWGGFFFGFDAVVEFVKTVA